MVCERHAGPHPTPDRCRGALARARRAGRARSGHQDHRGRGPPIPIAGSRPASRPSSARPSRPMRRGCSRSPASATPSASCSGLPINMDASEGPRAQSTRAFARNFSRLTDARHRAVGRAALHRRGRTRTDRHGHEPRPARRGDRRTCRDLHPAGRARPAGETAPGQFVASRLHQGATRASA